MLQPQRMRALAEIGGRRRDQRAQHGPQRELVGLGRPLGQLGDRGEFELLGASVVVVDMVWSPSSCG